MEKTGCRRYQADGRLCWNSGDMEGDPCPVYRDGPGTYDGMDKEQDPKKRIFTNDKSGAEVGTVSICRILFFVDVRFDMTGPAMTL